MKRTLTCALCGHIFDPQAQPGCRSCPLRPNCNLVCCPACGYETVDPGRSSLVRLFSRWLPALSDAHDSHKKAGD
jgi:hypothetical protein